MGSQRNCMQLETFRRTLMKSLHEDEDNSVRYLFDFLKISYYYYYYYELVLKCKYYMHV